jgi:nicotinamide phosphoribosyltransferase
MIDKFAGPGKLYACVSDSFNIYEAAGDLWGTKLKDKVIASGGTLVVRPDSGDPETVPVEVIEILMDKFGFTVNSKGFKVLPPYIRLIQGDGINEHSLPRIIDNMIAKRFSIDNIAFGMGGGLLQAWNRDTLKYAMKASARLDTAGVWHDVFKDPISDHGKLSKKGRLGLVLDGGIGTLTLRTMPKDIADKRGNVLRKVFRDGELLVEDTFAQVRERAALKEDEYVFTIVDRF